MDDWIQFADAEHIRRERQKAKELRRSQWWKSQKGKGTCHYCGERFAVDALTMDHVVPIARGGKTTRRNVVVSCKSCNQTKGAKLPNF